MQLGVIRQKYLQVGHRKRLIEVEDFHIEDDNICNGSQSQYE